MAVNVNFGLLGPAPNFGNSLAAGYQQGRQTAMQAKADNALAAYQANPDDQGAMNALLIHDPQRGTAIMQAKSAMQQQQDAAAQKDAAKNLYGTDGTVNASGLHDYVAKTGDIRGAMQLQQFAAQATDAQKKQALEASDALAAAGQNLKGIPYGPARIEALKSMAPALAVHGVTPDKIASFDPSDQNIDGIVAQSIGIKGVLANQESDTKDALAASQFAETQRHNRTEEGYRGAEVGVRQGALAVTKARFGASQTKTKGGSVLGLSDHSGADDTTLANLVTGGH